MVKKTKYKFRGKPLKLDDTKNVDLPDMSESCLKIHSRQLDILLCKDGLKKLNVSCGSPTSMIKTQPKLDGIQYLGSSDNVSSGHTLQTKNELKTYDLPHPLRENHLHHFPPKNPTIQPKKDVNQVKKDVPQLVPKFQPLNGVKPGHNFHLPVREASSECLLFTQRYLEQKSTCLEVFLKNGITPSDNSNHHPSLVSTEPYGFTSLQQPSDLSTTVVPHVVYVMVDGNPKPVSQRQGSLGLKSLAG